MRRLGLLGVVVLAACGSDPKITPCNTDADCNLSPDGQCVASSAGFDQCAYPLDACPSGYAFGDLSGSLSGTCVQSVFDVAYASEWRFSVAAPVIGGVGLIINPGTSPLALSGLRIVSVVDDHPLAVVQVGLTPPLSQLAPGTAIYRSADVVTSLVPETRIDMGTPEEEITMGVDGLAGPLDSTFDIHADITIAIGEIEVRIPTTLHMVSGLDPVIVADIESGARRSAFR